MSEILNLFVDGVVNTQDDANALLLAETSSVTEQEALRKSIAWTATRLLPHSQAERIVKLLKEGTD